MKKVAVALSVLVFLATSALVLASTSGYFTSLRSDLSDSQQPFRQAKAMRALSLRQDPAAIPLIAANLDSPFMDIRLDAIHSLARYKTPEAGMYLEQVMLSDDLFTINERFIAVRAYAARPDCDENVLSLVMKNARNPLEAKALGMAISGETLNLFGGGK